MTIGIASSSISCYDAHWFPQVQVPMGVADLPFLCSADCTRSGSRLLRFAQRRDPDPEPPLLAHARRGRASATAPGDPLRLRADCQNHSRTPLPRVLADPTPPWVPSPRLTLSTPPAPVLSPQTCCHHPGPRVAAAASSLTLAPESLFCRLFPGEYLGPVTECPVQQRRASTRCLRVGSHSCRQDPNASVATGASRTLPRQPLLLSEVRLLPGVANRARLRRACSAPSSQSARPLHPATPLVRLR
ncbi:unnamed protein product [Rangifer tarandus platyrhynchus]|uniref:Uncharacterized protein n=1 Tax=Rangifer tarandus platyrhynchus TaxID=3082113 RepID=A0AC59YGJ9_RANTA